MVGEKIRLRFAKTGPLRLLSHHDLMRCGERMLRRADLPFRRTAGFHPQPRLVFALSLPLGIAGRNEVVEVELTQPLDADEVRTRLNAQSPAGLAFHAATAVELKAAAVPRRAAYRLPLPPERTGEIRAACERLLATEKVWLDKLHPRPRRVNVRPYLRSLVVDDTALTLDVWVTTSGTVRIEDFLPLLGLSARNAVVERTELEIHDEVPPGAADAPPDGPPETAPLIHPPAAVAAGFDTPTAAATWGGSPGGPVVE